MDNKNNEDKFKGKTIKEILETEIQSDDELQEQLFHYITQMVKTEVHEKVDEYLNNTKSKDILTGKEFDNNMINSITYSNLDFDDCEIKSTLEVLFNEYNLNKSKIAEKININRATLNNIIKDPSSCSLLNAYKLSKLFNISIENLFMFVMMK